MIVGDAAAPQPDLPTEDDPIGVGEQRIVTRRPREHALGEPAHPQAIELDSEGEHRGPDEQSLAQPTDLVTRGIELEGERPPEHVEGRGRFDRVEASEAFERGIDAARGLPLERRPRGARGLRRRSSG